jgi:putative endonuclease
LLNTGVANGLKKRVWQHKGRFVESFTKRYHVEMLVYYEVSNGIESGIAREKQIKAGSRQKKIDLINKMNPEWRDLSEELYTFASLTQSQYDTAVSDCRVLQGCFGKDSQRQCSHPGESRDPIVE